jgi:hypothetical protein
MPKHDESTASPPVAAEVSGPPAAPPSAPDSPSALFEKMLESGPAPLPWPPGEPFVVDCTDASHPTLQGRVRIRWERPGRPAEELWVPTLHGQSIRKGDRLLVQVPHGATEPIVIGVIDGFLPRPEPARAPVARIELKRDEVFQVCSEDGQPLVQIIRDDQGPIVRLLQADTRIDLAGKLSISAAELELKATKGAVRIQASDDVNVIGEVVHLN